MPDLYPLINQGIINLIQMNGYNTWGEDIAAEYKAWLKIDGNMPVIPPPCSRHASLILEHTVSASAQSLQQHSISIIGEQKQEVANVDVSIVEGQCSGTVLSSVLPLIHVNVGHSQVRFDDRVGKSDFQKYTQHKSVFCSQLVQAIKLAAPIPVSTSSNSAEDFLNLDINDMGGNLIDTETVENVQETDGITQVLGYCLSDKILTDNLDSSHVPGVRSSLSGNDSKVTLEVPAMPGDQAFTIKDHVVHDNHMTILDAFPKLEYNTLDYLNNWLRLICGWQHHLDSEVYCVIYKGILIG
ncbi:hypothetical protein DACRYDRAFT_18705 [Dacryopinax primogenitus]|uniref:Uncharacterized protein n=1 Tax=Dacryopinax primogenitus (strain DJM 731) TaxID=1858805 RepID=M5FR20_DACPD|nr:uncharacterized protein DACRYDRAFT_18705 [Dacryopinax primogenitus]EJT97289.1 hypothetical protein DACRYDRAFT_18705 [Dacryopinax primogenitus]